MTAADDLAVGLIAAQLAGDIETSLVADMLQDFLDSAAGAAPNLSQLPDTEDPAEYVEAVTDLLVTMAGYINTSRAAMLAAVRASTYVASRALLGPDGDLDVARQRLPEIAIELRAHGRLPGSI